jgi:hypothetical protein
MTPGAMKEGALRSVSGTATVCIFVVSMDMVMRLIEQLRFRSELVAMRLQIPAKTL